MVMDLPQFYDISFGSLRDMYSDVLQRDEPVYLVAVDIEGSSMDYIARFFSRGNFRQDAVDVAQKALEENYLGKNLPKMWKKFVLGTKKTTHFFEGEDISLVISAVDFRRLAEISTGRQVENPERDKETGNMIFTREQFLIEYQGSYGDKLYNLCKDCFSSHEGLPQPPDEKGLVKVLEKEGKLFDLYMSFPVGSLMVTKDFIFPYCFGRKQHENFQWNRGLDRYCHEGRLPTVDKAMQLTGKDRDSHTKEAPVFRANQFCMDIVEDSFVVPPEKEREYFLQAVESIGKFNSIWMQNPPANCIPENASPYERNDWSPTKEQFIKGICDYLEIK